MALGKSTADEKPIDSGQRLIPGRIDRKQLGACLAEGFEVTGVIKAEGAVLRNADT
jgi:hypothetical protein